MQAFASTLREYFKRGISDRATRERVQKDMHRSVADHDGDVCQWSRVIAASPPPWVRVLVSWTHPRMC